MQINDPNPSPQLRLTSSCASPSPGIIIILVFGLPAVGKSTLCSSLQQHLPSVLKEINTRESKTEEWDLYFRCTLFCFDDFIVSADCDELVLCAEEEKKEEEEKRKREEEEDLMVVDDLSDILADKLKFKVFGGEEIKDVSGCAPPFPRPPPREKRQSKENEGGELFSDHANSFSLSFSWKDARKRVEEMIESHVCATLKRAEEEEEGKKRGIMGSNNNNDCKKNKGVEIVLVDDNMFYRKMRYKYYQMAGRYGCGFGEIMLTLSDERKAEEEGGMAIDEGEDGYLVRALLEVNHERVTSRKRDGDGSKSEFVKDETIIKMAKIFESPPVINEEEMGGDREEEERRRRMKKRRQWEDERSVIVYKRHPYDEMYEYVCTRSCLPMFCCDYYNDNGSAVEKAEDLFTVLGRFCMYVYEHPLEKTVAPAAAAGASTTTKALPNKMHELDLRIRKLISSLMKQYTTRCGKGKAASGNGGAALTSNDKKKLALYLNSTRKEFLGKLRRELKLIRVADEGSRGVGVRREGEVIINSAEDSLMGDLDGCESVEEFLDEKFTMFQRRMEKLFERMNTR